MLDQLDIIADALALDAPVVQSGMKARQAFGSKPPVSADWLDWIRGDEIRDFFGGLARIIHEDHAEYPWPQTTPLALVTWLRERWHDVMPAHEAVGEFVAELAPWSRRAIAVLGRTEQGQVIACPECSRRLRVDIAGDIEAVVECRCGYTATGSWLLRVSTDDGWVDAAAIVAGYGIAERTLRRWARAKKVRTRGLRPVLYSVSDVVAMMESGVALALDSDVR